MGRAPCCEKVGLKRGPWTPEEDQKLLAYVNENGHGSWRALPKKAGLLRCGKSCRLRWTNYLRPDIKRGEFSLSEEQTIIQLHALLGNRWSSIASHLPKRTDNEIKNYWNTHLKKKLVKMGVDPTTHKPSVGNTLMGSNANTSTNVVTGTGSLLLKATNSFNASSTTSHMAQWESARLEAESRLAQESLMRAKGLWRAGSGAPSPINVAPISTLAPWSATPVNGIANSNAARAEALKALGAVELLHALHNWEKSLQGQAGMMWPDTWRLPGAHLSMQEPQAESSSCSSHCSDANTNSSSLGGAGPHCLDHLSPTSTLCSFDSHSIKQKGFQTPIVSCAPSSAHVRKLSWSDALAPVATKLEMPVLLTSVKVTSEFDRQGLSCKMEEDSSTFSGLMRDAVFGADTSTSVYVSSLDIGASAFNNVPKKDVADEGTAGNTSKAHGGVSSGGAVEGADAKLTVASAMNQGVCNEVVDSSTCGKLVVMDKGVDNVTVVEGTCGAAYEGVSICKDSDKNSCSEALTQDACLTKGGGIDSILLHEIDMEGDVKGGAVDLDNTNSDDNSKNEDVDDDDEGKFMCIGGEMVSAEVFKDLPKLKSKVSTPHLTSYCALLSEEIPDYWSSIMLKEPSLQQVDMTF